MSPANTTSRLAELSGRFRTTGLTPAEVHELHELTAQAEERAWTELGMQTTCAGCSAEPGEPCDPFCLSHES